MSQPHEKMLPSLAPKLFSKGSRDGLTGFRPHTPNQAQKNWCVGSEACWPNLIGTDGTRQGSWEMSVKQKQ